MKTFFRVQLYLFAVTLLTSYYLPLTTFLYAKETLIEVSVEVAEINNRVARELGIKWVDTIRFGEILSKQSLTGVNPSDRTPQDLPSSQPTKVPWDFPSLIRSGETARFDPFIGELKALAERGAIKITSKPRILTKSGKKATFLSGGEFPVVTETATRINVAYKDFGIKLEIIPVELPDNFVDVQVEAEVSRLDFTQLVAGRYPILNTRRAKTQVVLKSEDTMALGGMVETKKSQGRIGIPFLKDIPVLGYLFGVRRNIDEESTVVIFVTPKIVKE